MKHFSHKCKAALTIGCMHIKSIHLLVPGVFFFHALVQHRRKSLISSIAVSTYCVVHASHPDIYRVGTLLELVPWPQKEKRVP